MIELLVVIAVALVIFAFGIPMMNNILISQRIGGDARSLAGALALAKMRAASDYTQTRLYMDLTSNTFRLEVCKTKTPAAFPTCSAWNLAEDQPEPLSSGVTIGFGTLATPPANTQAVIAEAAQCDATPNTACVTFNSRGIPIIPANNNPDGNGAIYITNGIMVYGATVSALGTVRIWRSSAKAANWQQI